MAREEDVDAAMGGTGAIEAWKEANPGATLDLADAELLGAPLAGSDLKSADLRGADLTGSDLTGADFVDADLSGADLTGANLSASDFSGANLSSANLTSAIMTWTRVDGADFDSATIFGCTFSDVDLSTALNLETCVHEGPSTIGIDTIFRSGGRIPDHFLRSCGVNPVIQPMLVGNHIEKTNAFYRWSEAPIQYASCFISYSTKDRPFVDRLQEALNEKGIDNWYAPEHGLWGQRIDQQVDRQISLRDRVILVCSEASLNESDWVQWEIAKAIDEEKRRKQTVLFPIMIDDALRNWDHPRGTYIREILAGDFKDCASGIGEKFDEAFGRLFYALYKDEVVGEA